VEDTKPHPLTRNAFCSQICPPTYHFRSALPPITKLGMYGSLAYGSHLGKIRMNRSSASAPGFNTGNSDSIKVKTMSFVIGNLIHLYYLLARVKGKLYMTMTLPCKLAAYTKSTYILLIFTLAYIYACNYIVNNNAPI